jgi:hypothetical protein
MFAAPLGPRQTVKGSAVVVIGVGRRSVGRDNGPGEAFPRSVKKVSFLRSGLVLFTLVSESPT